MNGITVCTTTLRRQPRFKETADSIVAAIKPPVAWEWLVVDGILWYDKHRREELKDAVAGRFPFRHVEPKPSLWQGPHRLTSRDYWDACSARNTAFIASQYSYVVFIDDCMEVEIDWFFQILRTNQAYAGTYVSLDRDRKVIEAGEDHRTKLCPEPQIVNGGWLYGMNMGVPLVDALRVDGYDEMYSGAGGVEDADFGIRLDRAGCKTLWNPDSIVYQLTETHEPIGGHAGDMTQRTQASLPPKPKERVLKNGMTRFANEFLTERLMNEPTRFMPLLYRNISHLRELYLKGEPLPVPKGPLKDWRDGQALEEM